MSNNKRIRFRRGDYSSNANEVLADGQPGLNTNPTAFTGTTNVVDDNAVEMKIGKSTYEIDDNTTSTTYKDGSHYILSSGQYVRIPTDTSLSYSSSVDYYIIVDASFDDSHSVVVEYAYKSDESNDVLDTIKGVIISDSEDYDASSLYLGWSDSSNRRVRRSDRVSITESVSTDTAQLAVVNSNEAGLDGKVRYRSGLSVSSGNELTAVSFNANSDRRLKKNIKKYNNSALAIINSVDIKKYNFKDNPSVEQIGMIAQDLQKVCPELVVEDDKGMLSIKESKLVYVLWKAVQELSNNK